MSAKMAPGEKKVNTRIPAYPSQIEKWEALCKRFDKSKSWLVRRVLNAAAAGVYKPTIGERKKKRGRIEAEEELSQFQFKAHKWEIQAWHDEAEKHSIETAEWQRQVMDELENVKDWKFLLADLA